MMVIIIMALYADAIRAPVKFCSAPIESLVTFPELLTISRQTLENRLVKILQQLNMKDSDFSYKLLIIFVGFHVQQPYFVELLRYHSFKFIQSFS